MIEQHSQQDHASVAGHRNGQAFLHGFEDAKEKGLNKSWALLLDIDGTLLDIAPTPEAVLVPPNLVTLLETISMGLDGAIALVSGRAIANIDRLFAPLQLPASGQNGAELRLAPGGEVVKPWAIPVDNRIRGALEGLPREFPGVRIEDKKDSIAVHYREIPAAAKPLGHRLMGIIADIGGLTLMPGKAVWEVKGAGYDKGTAVVELMRSPLFRGRRPAFLGDDVADEDGFRAAEALGGLGLRVGPGIEGRPAAFQQGQRVGGVISAKH